MLLPTQKVKAAYTSPRTMVLYGKVKVGKTEALSKLDNCLIVDLERGTDMIDALKVSCENLKEFSEICKLIETSIIELNKDNKTGIKKYPYKFLAIDTVTKLEEWCETLAISKYMATPIGKNFKGESILELPNGAGYFWLRLAFKEVQDRIEKLAPYIIYIGHIKDKMVEKAGKEVSSSDIDLTGKIKTILCQSADAVGYIYRKSDGTYVSFKSSDEIACGSRCEHLKGQDIKLEWNDIYQ